MASLGVVIFFSLAMDDVSHIKRHFAVFICFIPCAIKLILSEPLNHCFSPNLFNVEKNSLKETKDRHYDVCVCGNQKNRYRRGHCFFVYSCFLINLPHLTVRNNSHEQVQQKYNPIRNLFESYFHFLLVQT